MSDIFTEAERVLSGLKSYTPGFDAVADAAALIYRFVAEHRGPDGFATWKEAAVAERVRRVKAEARAAHQPPAVQPRQSEMTEDEYYNYQPPAASQPPENPKPLPGSLRLTSFGEEVSLGSGEGATDPAAVTPCGADKPSTSRDRELLLLVRDHLRMGYSGKDGTLEIGHAPYVADVLAWIARATDPTAALHQHQGDNASAKD